MKVGKRNVEERHNSERGSEYAEAASATVSHGVYDLPGKLGWLTLGQCEEIATKFLSSSASSIVSGICASN